METPRQDASTLLQLTSGVEVLTTAASEEGGTDQTEGAPSGGGGGGYAGYIGQVQDFDHRDQRYSVTA
jgi:hypothetical protein